VAMFKQVFRDKAINTHNVRKDINKRPTLNVRNLTRIAFSIAFMKITLTVPQLVRFFNVARITEMIDGKCSMYSEM
jgi:hypothetical protein